MKPGRIVALVVGCLVALIGAALLIGAGALTWAYATQRDDDGYFTSRQLRIETVTPALRSESIDLGSDDRPDRWPFGNGDLATVRLQRHGARGRTDLHRDRPHEPMSTPTLPASPTTR